MAWRDDLQPASFRGIKFFVRVAEGGHGRRLASHAYPLRDDPWHEDLGRKAKSFSFDAYVLEPGHVKAANDLIGACETKGPGKLIHPWLGSLDVVLTDCRVRFSHDEGGLATFSLAFVEAGKPVYPTAEVVPEAVVDKAALAAKNASTNRLLQGFTVSKVAGWVSQNATRVLGDAVTAIETALGTPGGVAGAVGWARDLATIAQTATTIVRDPAGMARRILGAIDLGNVSGGAALVQFPVNLAEFAETFTQPLSTFISPNWQSYLPLSRYGIDGALPFASTPSRERDNKNTEELIGFVRRTSTIEMARAAVRQEYATSQEADAAVMAIQEATERELQTATDEDGPAIQRVANEATRALVRKSDTLPTSFVLTPLTATRASATALPPTSGQSFVPIAPRLFSIAPIETMPAIVIAYAVYGQDIDARAEQIIARNSIPHAGFVPGGEPLELLSA